MADGDYRDIWISLAVFTLIVSLANLVLANHPDAKSAVAMAAFFGAILLRQSIADREHRKHKHD
ncbi:MAG: hypothetical protein WA687_05490 [Solirubrobacterales bacterium]